MKSLASNVARHPLPQNGLFGTSFSVQFFGLFQYRFASHDHESRYQTFQPDIFCNRSAADTHCCFTRILSGHRHDNRGNHTFAYRYNQHAPDGKVCAILPYLSISGRYRESTNQLMYPWSLPSRLQMIHFIRFFTPSCKI